ncbi:unnamed protein product, partial [Ectocarpus sp. 4 AP-2014]
SSAAGCSTCWLPYRLTRLLWPLVVVHVSSPTTRVTSVDQESLRLFYRQG